MDDIPAPILEDCAQLVKANSIQGNKLNNIEIVYTPHTNLKKLASMEVGQAMLSSCDWHCLWRSRQFIAQARSMAQCFTVGKQDCDLLVCAGQFSQCQACEEGEGADKD